MRYLCIIIGSILLLVLGNVLPITDMYSGYIVHSHDDENKLVKMIIFVEWPLYLTLGGWLGNLAYKKYTTTG